MALIVLDSSRRIQLLSGLAEAALDVSNSSSVGRQVEQYFPQCSRGKLEVALAEASEAFAKSSALLSTPHNIRLEINPREGQESEWADLSISAWYQSETSSSSAIEKMREVKLGRPPRRPQDASFTIAMTPCARAGFKRREEEPNSAKKRKRGNDVLKEYISQQFGVALLAVNKQGKVVGRNKACMEVFARLRGREYIDEMGAEDEVLEEDLDLSWLGDCVVLTDEHYQNVIQDSDWPIYRSAILGEYPPVMLMGSISKLDGRKGLFEVTSVPVRENGGTGEHIGGVVTMRDIIAERERARLEAEMQGDIYFKQTCNALPQMAFVTSPDGDKEWYNDSWYTFSGASRETSNTEAWLPYFHPNDVENLIRQWRMAIEKKETFEAAYRFKRHDDVYRWLQVRALPIKDASGNVSNWFGTCTDVHDHLEALRDSQRAHEQVESVIRHAHVTIWSVDREGIITFAKGPGISSLRYLKELRRRDASGESKQGTEGGEEKDILGISVYEVLQWPTLRANINRALAGETVEEETEVEGKWNRSCFTPLKAQRNSKSYSLPIAGIVDDKIKEGDIIGVVGTSLDITDRKKAQSEIERTLMEKSIALASEEAAREASRLKSEFLANMSHEIRTPIAGVIGLAELLLDELNLTSKVRDYGETIQRSAEGLMTVINDVLDFSKVEIGRLEVEQEPFDLELLIKDAKRMLTFATRKKGLQLEFQETLAELDYSGLLIGDVGRLKQVITNLLTNAIKFTAKGHISLKVNRVSENNDMLEICFNIQDTGCGISASHLSKLFQPFQQADSSTARRFGGTGLGLSISKKLVKLMNGKIGLNSVEGQGSHAWFSIPFFKAEQGARRSSYRGGRNDLQVEDIPYIHERFSPRQRRDIWILIAEDNAINARIAIQNVERMGFNCRIAKNGLLALEELKAREFDLILMDCQMPECDGYEATRKIRSSRNPKYEALPIIALTASAIIGDRERALEAGMVDYLSKPVKRSALESVVCKWLFDQSARSGLRKFSTLEEKAASGMAVADNRAEGKRDSFRQALSVSASTNRGDVQDMASLSSSSKGTSSPKTKSSTHNDDLFCSQNTSMWKDDWLSSSRDPGDSSDEHRYYHQHGDRLVAVASLLAYRRSSAEEIHRRRSILQEENSDIGRPVPASRSHSYSGTFKPPMNLFDGQNYPSISE
ncbi:hypothetical protein CBS101457_005583 [Exobasidium rhododendri]|nr:hypothetical protein CBS101457_005583 [Exobasidium rhododendri]